MFHILSQRLLDGRHASVLSYTRLNHRSYVVDPTSLLRQCPRDCNVLEVLAENQDGRGLSECIEQSIQRQISVSFSATTLDKVANID